MKNFKKLTKLKPLIERWQEFHPTLLNAKEWSAYGLVLKVQVKKVNIQLLHYKLFLV